MNNRTLVVVAIIILVLVAIGIVVFRGKGSSSTSTTSTSTTSTEPSTSPSPTPTATPQGSVTISYTKNGFVPSSVTVKSGGTVTFKNDSSEQLQVNSNPHPTHTDNPELNVGAIAPGQSKSITVTTKGTWGYHNHLDPSDGGTIVVQ